MGDIQCLHVFLTNLCKILRFLQSYFFTIHKDMTFKLGKFSKFNVTFLDVSMDIHYLAYIKGLCSYLIHNFIIYLFFSNHLLGIILQVHYISTAILVPLTRHSKLLRSPSCMYPSFRDKSSWDTVPKTVQFVLSLLLIFHSFPPFQCYNYVTASTRHVSTLIGGYGGVYWWKRCVFIKGSTVLSQKTFHLQKCFNIFVRNYCWSLIYQVALHVLLTELTLRITKVYTILASTNDHRILVVLANLIILLHCTGVGT